MLKASNSVECSSDKVKLQFKGNPFEKGFFFFRQTKAWVKQERP